MRTLSPDEFILVTSPTNNTKRIISHLLTLVVWTQLFTCFSFIGQYFRYLQLRFMPNLDKQNCLHGLKPLKTSQENIFFNKVVNEYGMISYDQL